MKDTAKYMVHPARYEDETYEDYKKRRTMANKTIKRRLQKGFLFWPSSKAGTYVKDEV